MNIQLVKFVHKLNRCKFSQEPGSYTTEKSGLGFSAKEKLFFPKLEVLHTAVNVCPCREQFI